MACRSRVEFVVRCKATERGRGQLRFVVLSIVVLLFVLLRVRRALLIVFFFEQTHAHARTHVPTHAGTVLAMRESGNDFVVYPSASRQHHSLAALSGAAAMNASPEPILVATLSFDAASVAGYVIQHSSSVHENAAALQRALARQLRDRDGKRSKSDRPSTGRRHKPTTTADAPTESRTLIRSPSTGSSSSTSSSNSSSSSSSSAPPPPPPPPPGLPPSVLAQQQREQQQQQSQQQQQQPAPPQARPQRPVAAAASVVALPPRSQSPPFVAPPLSPGRAGSGATTTTTTMTMTMTSTSTTNTITTPSTATNTATMNTTTSTTPSSTTVATQQAMTMVGDAKVKQPFHEKIIRVRLFLALMI